MTQVSEAVTRLDHMMERKIAHIQPFRAIVTGFTSGLVSIRTLSSATGGTEQYAMLAGEAPRVGDEVLCVQVRGKPVILGIVQRALSIPTITPQAGAGTGATITNQFGDDVSGHFDVNTTSTGLAAGALVRVTFGTAKADTNYTVIVTPGSTAAASLSGNWNVTSNIAASFDIRLGSAPSASSVYRWFYFIREEPW